MTTMDWNQLSREIARETGLEPDGWGFSQGGQHPWVIAAIRIATLRERKAIEEIFDDIFHPMSLDLELQEACSEFRSALRNRSAATIHESRIDPVDLEDQA